MEFNHLIIEKKWQKIWEENKTYRTDLSSDKPKFYALDMFPYPSGAGLHVGHPEGYTATDIISRMKKMQGYEVLHPIGWDAFGLPAEQYAIKTGNNPKDFTQKNINNFKKQLKALGFSFDWEREINTSDPNYYKWTQWIFAQMYKKDLVELRDIEVNWSPSLNTVLANEEVITNDNDELISERNGLPVQKKKMKQWVLKITKYAQRLFNGLDGLDWPESVKKLQKNWIYFQDNDGNFTKELHLHDWVFARQRYWGEPFPIVYFEDGEIYLLPESSYPIELPILKEYKFSNDGKPALSKAKDWINIEINGKKVTRDFNTMPQWAGSCWYYLAYLLKTNETYLEINSLEAKEIFNKWLPVDLYIGGQEHAVLHLLYARFWHQFLFDIGILSTKEPFKKLFNQGMILGPDGFKMSKSKGNVINPDQMIEKYGADTLRLYVMFMGKLDDDKSWSYEQIHGARNWLDRVNRLFMNEVNYIDDSLLNDQIKLAFNDLLNKINKYYLELKFNVSISEMMIFINTIFKFKQISKKMAIAFLQVLSCVAPHLANELASKIDDKFLDGSLYYHLWPKLYSINFEKKELEVVVQINGKVRGKKIISFLDLRKLSSEELKELVIQIVPNYVHQNTIFQKVLIIKDNLIVLKI